MIKIKKNRFNKFFKKFLKIKQFFISNNSEIFFILGLFFIFLATFFINKIASLYILGVEALIISYILTRPRRLE